MRRTPSANSSILTADSPFLTFTGNITSPSSEKRMQSFNHLVSRHSGLSLTTAELPPVNDPNCKLFRVALPSALYRDMDGIAQQVHHHKSHPTDPSVVDVRINRGSSLGCVLQRILLDCLEVGHQWNLLESVKLAKLRKPTKLAELKFVLSKTSPMFCFRRPLSDPFQSTPFISACFSPAENLI